MQMEAVVIGFINFHCLLLNSSGFKATWGQKVGQPVAGCGIEWQICRSPLR